MIILKAITTGSLLLLSFLVFVKGRKENIKANSWLSFFLFCVSLTMLDECFTDTRFYLDYPHFFYLTDFFIFALAPSLYLSVLFFVEPGKKFRATLFVHFIPFLLLSLLNIPNYFETADAKRQEFLMLLQPSQEQNLASDIALSLLFLQCFIYLGASLRRLFRYQKDLKRYLSNLRGVQLQWMIYLTLGILFMLLLWIGEYILFRNHIEFAAYWGYLAAAYFIGYFALQQKELFPYPPKELREIQTLLNNPKQVELSRTEDTTVGFQAKKQALIATIEQEKTFLDNELSLPKLARQLSMTTHELSALINQGFNQNFFQFVNTFRIEESKRLLLDPAYSHLNMLGIAYESGFNSKTTFNTTFKNVTGMSPSEYRMTHLQKSKV